MTLSIKKNDKRFDSSVDKTKIFVVIILMIIITVVPFRGYSNNQYFPTDTVKTSKGNLEIQVIGHCFFHFRFNKINIYVDPLSNLVDISQMPKADIILITHDHRDHLNENAINTLSKPGTKIFTSKSCISKIKFGHILENNMQVTIDDIYIKAVPAYNTVHIRPDNIPFHPKGAGNGYFMVFGDKTVYISGDTEYIDEMRFFMKPDIAFITVMMPFTMDNDMCIKSVKKLTPKILYLLSYNIDKDSLKARILEALPNVLLRVPY